MRGSMPGALRKINIMHTVISLEVGGLEKIVCDMVRGFDKKLFNVEVCCFSTLGELAEKLVDDGINVTLLQITTKHYDPFYPLRLGRFLRAKKVDVLHMHSGTFFIGAQAGFLARTPAMIYTDHGRHLVDPKRLILMNRFSAMFVDKIVAVSRELEEYLANVVKLPRRKISTIINGIDTVKFSPRPKSASLLREFGISENTKIIGTVGRLAEVKDQSSMIEAFEVVNRHYPDSVLMLVGDGPMKSELQQLVVDRKLDERVIFTGSRSDVSELLNLFDVYLLTSLSEGTSISLLEAMASGVPPVVTDVGGNPSVVSNGINGFVVKPKDTVNISEKIINLLENVTTCKTIKNNAVTTVRQNYSLSNMIDRYASIYREMIYGN